MPTGAVPRTRPPDAADARHALGPRARRGHRRRGLANGLLAAYEAGLATVVTVNGYTRGEDSDEAALVVSSLGDPGAAPIEVLADRVGAEPGDYVTLANLQACLP